MSLTIEKTIKELKKLETHEKTYPCMDGRKSRKVCLEMEGILFRDRLLLSLKIQKRTPKNPSWLL